MLLYYISDRRQFPGSPDKQKELLLQRIAECAAAGVDYIQLREKDLSGRELQELAEQAVRLIPPGSRTRLLVNSRADVALAAGAQGVHLPATALSPGRTRALLDGAGQKHSLVAVSAHTAQEVKEAHAQGADFAVFGPVFEKDAHRVVDGLQRLQEACRCPIPVLALGGVTLGNARRCFAAGAAGIAAIRLFQQNVVAETLKRLKEQR